MSMAYTAVAVALITAGTGAYTQYASSENAQEVGDYNKKVADNAALDAEQRGSTEAAEHRQRVRRLIATQNATYSAAGVDASTGTPAEVQVDTAGFGELDALRMLNNAQRGAAGYRSQGGMEKWKGDASYTNGMFELAGQAVGNLGGSALTANKLGMFGGGKK